MLYTVSMSLRVIPSLDALLESMGPGSLPRPLLGRVLRGELQAIRNQSPPNLSREQVIARCQAAIERLTRSRLQPVVNGAGILIHTNLGRSPLSDAAVTAISQAARFYNTLEFDLADGDRGTRGEYVETALAALCQSEAATLVNNCAAALVLILRCLAPAGPKNRVILSRGELVQIGGGFRVPEILSAAGVELCEVGTTNRTTVDDYQSAIDERTAMILKVHPSNFFMGGFVAAPSSEQIAAVARAAGIAFVEDLGGGAVFDTRALGGGEREPAPADAIAGGADLVCFSGDKLLGGPQAGVIAGKGSLVAALKRHPFFRALRCDKLIFAAMGATLDALLAGRETEIPIRRMIQIPIDELQRRAESILAAVDAAPARLQIGRALSQVGGGTLPRTQIPSVCLELRSRQDESIEKLAALLRAGEPPLVGFIERGSLRFDLRTIFPEQDAQVVRRLKEIA